MFVEKKTRKLAEMRAWLFDLDGTLYRGGGPMPGARDLLAALRASGKSVGFVTNNSRHTAAEIALKLEGMGLEASARDIVTATECTGQYIRERYGCLKVAAAGSPAFEAALRAAGHRLVEADEAAGAADKAGEIGCAVGSGEAGGTARWGEAGEIGRVDAVVVGLDAAFTYAKLERLAQLVRDGAMLIAANGDASHPGADGRAVPETGALVAAIEAVSGRRAIYTGKPEPYLFGCALERCGVAPELTAMVGDNCDTDIAGGRRAGLYTIWLNDSSGAAGAPEAASASGTPAADKVVRCLEDLYRELRSGGEKA